MGAARPTATILVIAYRNEGTIADALRSALAQTVPCEIIVSDDSGGDRTLDVAREIAAGYDGPHRITIRSTPVNIGLCAHLTELAQLATGDVLVCFAGDDASYPQRVEKLLDRFVAFPDAQIVGSHVDDVDATGALLKAGTRGTPEMIDQRWLLRRGKLAAVLGASMAIRRTLLTEFPPLEGKVEDNMLTLRAVLAGECHCLPQALVAYRRHDSNLGDWVFDRSGTDYAAFERRQRRVLAMYREIAADQRRCIAARPDLPVARRMAGQQLADMYALEADMREAVLDRPRREWLGPLWSGLRHPGLRRKSAERALKLLLPRSIFGRG
ncbi:glycosyltransferase [Lysobacter claricitrinus]|uniref:glycosyltransferase n=1 Tax=Lysobacter claricitrinus TaxID=3367728 RepID=UPI0037DBA227